MAEHDHIYACNVLVSQWWQHNTSPGQSVVLLSFGGYWQESQSTFYAIMLNIIGDTILYNIV